MKKDYRDLVGKSLDTGKGKNIPFGHISQDKLLISK